MLNSSRILPKSWSSTLQLPKSTFPARALLADRSKYLQRCTDDLYAWQRLRLGQKERFTLHDGPPYANGSLHIGHALNKILKDITCRFQLAQGKIVDYVPGWDCHGLPIELKALEKRIDLKQQANAIAIRESAQRLAQNAVEDQKWSFREWGIMADWNNAWKTMHKSFEISQLGVFNEMVKKGLIYRRFKPVYWSPSSRTALAEAELEYRENHISTAAFVKYPLQNDLPQLDAVRQFGSGEVNAVIWTTTPWTLPANRAIGYHSEIDYAVVNSVTHGLLLLAESRIEHVKAACGEELEVIAIVQGSQLLGTTYSDTIFRQNNPAQPFLHADFVSADSGSGLIHLAPGHGSEDYDLCLRHGIDAFAPVDDDGCFTAGASPDQPSILLGKPVLTEGNKSILDYLTSRGCILNHHGYTHKYPYDWRTKKPVILRATEQWFADVGEIRETALQSLEVVNFIPPGGKERLRSFVKNRSEWCISRQRAWGVPIPALYHKETGQAVLTEESVSHIISVMQDRGPDAWWIDDESLDGLWTAPGLRDKFPESAYRRGTDTMDVWFDSGCSWTQTNTGRDGSSHVADVCLEGTDQHRGWFQSSLLTYIAYQNKLSTEASPRAPYKTLITHGFTLDEHGRKMSKSIGNVISPDEIMQGTLLPPIVKKRRVKDATVVPEAPISYDAMGPDALRLWAASCDYSKDVVVSQAVLKAVNSILVKYRVTFKMLLGILEDFSPATEMNELETVHQIALIQLRKLHTNVLLYCERFEFNKALVDINRYITIDLSSFYIETIKDIVYANEKSSESRLQAQFTLYQVFCQLQAMLAPVTPLLVEEVWDYAPKQIQHLQRTMLTNDSHVQSHSAWRNERLEKDLPFLMSANAAVKTAQEAARSEKKMGSSLQSDVLFQCQSLTAKSAKSAFELCNRYRADLETLTVVSNVEIYAGAVPPHVSAAKWSYQVDFEIDGSRVVAHIYSPQKAKCIRCWKYTAPVAVEEHESLCNRCEGVVEKLRRNRPELFQNSLSAHGTTAAA